MLQPPETGPIPALDQSSKSARSATRHGAVVVGAKHGQECQAARREHPPPPTTTHSGRGDSRTPRDGRLAPPACPRGLPSPRGCTTTTPSAAKKPRDETVKYFSDVEIHRWFRHQQHEHTDLTVRRRASQWSQRFGRQEGGRVTERGRGEACLV